MSGASNCEKNQRERGRRSQDGRVRVIGSPRPPHQCLLRCPSGAGAGCIILQQRASTGTSAHASYRTAWRASTPRLHQAGLACPRTRPAGLQARCLCVKRGRSGRWWSGTRGQLQRRRSRLPRRRLVRSGEARWRQAGCERRGGASAQQASGGPSAAAGGPCEAGERRTT